MDIKKNSKGSWISDSERRYRMMLNIVTTSYAFIFFAIFLLTWYKVSFFNLFSGISFILFLANIALMAMHLPLLISKQI
ncbi:hypothetical protein CN953_02155, partial [Bacillus thuringiensis]